MQSALERVTPSFRDPVDGSQRVFRALLDAMARPGRIVALSSDAVAGVVPPLSADPARPMAVGTACVLLSLLDRETSVTILGDVATDDAVAFLRFHTGVRPTSSIESSAFVLGRGDSLDATRWNGLALGSDEIPQAGATLVVEVDSLDVGPGPGGASLVLRGPGIASVDRLSIGGLSRAFWDWRVALQASFPRGIDLIATCDLRVACIPRSTRVDVEH